MILSELIIDIDGLYQGGSGINNSYVRVIWITKTDLDQCLHHASVYASHQRLESMMMILDVQHKILRVIAKSKTRESYTTSDERVARGELGRERESIPGTWYSTPGSQYIQSTNTWQTGLGNRFGARARRDKRNHVVIVLDQCLCGRRMRHSHDIVQNRPVSSSK